MKLITTIYNHTYIYTYLKAMIMITYIFIYGFVIRAYRNMMVLVVDGTLGSQRLEQRCSLIAAGFPCFFGLGSEDGQVPNFWIPP